MKRILQIFVAASLLLILNHLSSTAFGQGTAFTYQGQLQNSGALASGTYNLQFTLYTTNGGVGTIVGGPVTSNGVLVTNGLFTVMIDFGSAAWNGETNWLQIGVESNGIGSFTPLSPRQQLTPVPYAIFAESASSLSGTVSASQLTSIGNNSGGFDNFFVGSSGNSTTSGSQNTAYGYGALTNISSGNGNTAIGRSVLFNNTSGSDNVAVGPEALDDNTSGSNNIGLGFFAGFNITTGSSNIDIGSEGLATDTNITRIGSSQGQAYIAGIINGNGGGLTNLNASQLTSGTVSPAQLPSAVVTNNEPSVTLSNVTLSGLLTLPSPATIESGGSSILQSDNNDNFYAGPGAGTPTNSGSSNTGIGVDSLGNNINGTNNTAIGFEALRSNTNGAYNTASGERALLNNTSGDDNTADGRHALENNSSGNDNTAEGYAALSANPGGSNNIAIGSEAGSAFGNYESSNIDVGNPGVGGDNNIIRIGSGQTSTFIAGVINGNGGGLTNLNVSLAQLPSAVVTNNEPAVSLGTLTLGGLLLPDPATINVPVHSPLYPYPIFNYTLLISDFANDNLYLGEEAGSATGGNGNTGVGSFVLGQNTSGSQNVALGFSALANSTNDNQLVAIGYEALQNDNAFNNRFTDSENGENTAIGYQALQLNARGSANTAIGYEALNLNTSGVFNTAIGDRALLNNENGNNNTAIGYQALSADTSGAGNTAIGYDALQSNTNGLQNTAVGSYALQYDTSGGGDVANGSLALELNSSGNDNVASGYQALESNQSGNNNTAIGNNALESLGASGAGGTNNIALGNGAAANFNNNESGNIDIGNPGTAGENNIIRIGTPGQQTATYLVGNVFTASGTVEIGSDRNTKEDFAAVNPRDVLAKVAGLPITEWNYKTTKSMEHIGPMAQDFHSAFGLNGADDKHISVVDEGGVALAAIQGLNQKLEAQAREKDGEIQDLKQRLDALEKIVLKEKSN